MEVDYLHVGKIEKPVSNMINLNLILLFFTLITLVTKVTPEPKP